MRFLAGLTVGVLLAIVLIVVGVYIYFSAGLAPVSTSAQAMPFERKLAKMALHTRVEKGDAENRSIATQRNRLHRC